MLLFLSFYVSFSSDGLIREYVWSLTTCETFYWLPNSWSINGGNQLANRMSPFVAHVVNQLLQNSIKKVTWSIYVSINLFANINIQKYTLTSIVEYRTGYPDHYMPDFACRIPTCYPQTVHTGLPTLIIWLNFFPFFSFFPAS